VPLFPIVHRLSTIKYRLYRSQINTQFLLILTLGGVLLLLRRSPSTGEEDNYQKALAMLSGFASVGARVFDLSVTDINGDEVKGLQRPGRSLERFVR
jgi:hypothetical protein